jgi:hypothetical protein
LSPAFLHCAGRFVSECAALPASGAAHYGMKILPKDFGSKKKLSLMRAIKKLDGRP